MRCDAPNKALPRTRYWAIRPKRNWGLYERPSCGRPQESRPTSDQGEWDNWSSRVFLRAASRPTFQLARTDSDFGDRRGRPFGSRRDILVSGCLYRELLQAKFRGLLKPDTAVCIDGSILKNEALEVCQEGPQQHAPQDA